MGTAFRRVAPPSLGLARVGCQFRLGTAAVVQPKPEHPAPHVETIEGVEPLDAQIGVFPKKAVPDALYDALFGQPGQAETDATGEFPAAAASLHTYAILDAAEITNLPELLERSGLGHRCLFKGDDYDELKNVAPWVVRLEDDNAFTRHLFTQSDANGHLWNNEPGIYVRSRGTLDDMWKDFRKFTRLQDESGKWHFFKFWVARTLYKLPNHGASQQLLDHLLRSCHAVSIVCYCKRYNTARVMKTSCSAGAPDRRLVLTSDAKTALSEITHENAQEDIAWSVCMQSGGSTDYDQTFERTRQRCSDHRDSTAYR